ncbi:hypothetical protein EDC04DRAFT_2606004 [Pisolithus marmoratus]|nr:hypothetical protein EDC04DRAFT_2606004 [Pisolithus marmoratus]
MTTIELTDEDVIPIHQQQFPVTVPLPPQSKVDVNVPIYSNANANIVAEDGSAERTYLGYQEDEVNLQGEDSWPPEDGQLNKASIDNCRPAMELQRHQISS